MPPSTTWVTFTSLSSVSNKQTRFGNFLPLCPILVSKLMGLCVGYCSLHGKPIKLIFKSIYINILIWFPNIRSALFLHNINLSSKKLSLIVLSKGFIIINWWLRGREEIKENDGIASMQWGNYNVEDFGMGESGNCRWVCVLGVTQNGKQR